jgi:MEMO1 family protein
MFKRTDILSIFVCVFLLQTNCKSQNKQGMKNDDLLVRQPAVAGQFYPSDSVEIIQMLNGFFSKAEPANKNDYHRIRAIIVPHAGYVFSGPVAASAYNQLDSAWQYDNIFIIGSSHHASFEGAAVYCGGAWQTPLGKVKVNNELARELIASSAVFTENNEVHQNEHCLEVQLPFIQKHMKHQATIVPILIGTRFSSVCRKIALSLEPYFNEKNLFIISSDFSHYPEYSDAQLVDKLTADAIASNLPEQLLQTLEQNEEKNISNLATSLCGWTSVLSLLYITSEMPSVRIIPVQYQNSGDSKYSDKTRVVGYYALKVLVDSTSGNKSKNAKFELKETDKTLLLNFARKSIEYKLNGKQDATIDLKQLSAQAKANMGAFVTLRINGELRGCIGRFTSNQPLYDVVQQMAIAAATQDTRFSPLTLAELNKVHIEISVLTPMQRIQSIDEIELGRHGIYIKKGFSSGTFLPQVATETHWTKEEFLGHCARDKAGIGWDGWKDAEIYIYEAYVFEE